MKIFLIKAHEQFTRESWVVRTPYQDIFDANIGPEGGKYHLNILEKCSLETNKKIDFS